MRFSADIFNRIFPFFPIVNIFPFSTEEDIRNDDSPLTIITGSKSDLYGDAMELRHSLKESDHFFVIENADHKTILGDRRLKKLLANLLSKDGLTNDYPNWLL